MKTNQLGWAGALAVGAVTVLAIPALAQKPFLDKARKMYELDAKNGKCDLCHEIKPKEEPSRKTLNTYGKAIQGDPDMKPLLGKDEGRALHAARGCPACTGTGYAGRTGVFEVMPVSRAIRDLISDGAPTRDIRATAVGQGMLEFRQAALLKVARGETSTEEMFRVIPTEVLLEADSDPVVESAVELFVEPAAGSEAA